MACGRSLPYLPVRVDRILGPVSLTHPTRGDAFNLPWWRLNLLVCKHDALYVAGPSDTSSIFVYGIKRGCSCAISVHPVSARRLGQGTHINNLALMDTDDHHSYLLAAGGDPIDDTMNGTVNILPLHENDGVCEPGQTVNSTDLPRPVVFQLDCKSAWGVDTCGMSEMLAISSNSHFAMTFRLQVRREPQLNFQLEQVTPPLLSHFANVPCVAFSSQRNSPILLLTASIDTTFCIYNIDDGGRLLYQSPQVTEYSSHTRGNWCWSVLWLSSKTFKPVSKTDVVWKALTFKCHQGLALDMNELEQERRKSCTASPTALDAASHTAVRSNEDALPVYDDSDADIAINLPESLMREVHELWTPNMPNQREQQKCDIRGTPVCSSHTHGYSSDPQVFQQYSDPCLEDDTKSERIMAHSLSDADDRYFIVGRLIQLSLLRLYRKGTQYAVEEIAVLELPQGNVAASGMMRISMVLEVPRLSCIVAIQQSGSVAIVRLVYKLDGNDNPGFRQGLSRKPMMILERMIAESAEPIAGASVNERDGNTYELFILRATGFLECYQLERRREAGICISSLLV